MTESRSVCPEMLGLGFLGGLLRKDDESERKGFVWFVMANLTVLIRL